MADDKTLQDTLKEVASEVKTQTQTAEKSETKEGLSDTNKGETTSGETPEYVRGIDISPLLKEVPEQDRTRYKDLLTKAIEEKTGLLEKGYHEKYQKVASLDKAMERLNQLGLNPEEAESVLSKHAESKKLTVAEKKELKTLDSQVRDIENNSSLSYQEKQSAINQLQLAGRMIREEAGTEDLKKEVTELRNQVKVLLGSHFEATKSKVETELDSLSKSYGNIVEKNRDMIRDEAVKFNVSPKQVLFFRFPREVEEAILKPKKATQEKMAAVTSSGSGMTGSDAINIKQPMKSFLKDILGDVRKK